MVGGECECPRSGAGFWDPHSCSFSQTCCPQKPLQGCGVEGRAEVLRGEEDVGGFLASEARLGGQGAEGNSAAAGGVSGGGTPGPGWWQLCLPWGKCPWRGGLGLIMLIRHVLSGSSEGQKQLPCSLSSLTCLEAPSQQLMGFTGSSRRPGAGAGQAGAWGPRAVGLVPGAGKHGVPG